MGQQDKSERKLDQSTKKTINIFCFASFITPFGFWSCSFQLYHKDILYFCANVWEAYDLCV